jgi:hypothetical protein
MDCTMSMKKYMEDVKKSLSNIIDIVKSNVAIGYTIKVAFIAYRDY